MSHCNHKHPLQHDGTSQAQRMIAALDPTSAPVHEFTLRDWMKFAYSFAKHVKFYNNADHQFPDGNWVSFFKSPEILDEYLKDKYIIDSENWLSDDEKKLIGKREPSQNYDPHLALFISFIKLCQLMQGEMNKITERHLDFYYDKVLGLKKREAQPDKVHVIFELAKNVTGYNVPAQSELDAGKDNSSPKKPLRYETSGEISINTAKVSLLKSVFHDHDYESEVGSDSFKLRRADITNSTDGIGGKLVGNNPTFQAMGQSNWPAAKVGFAIASSHLLLSSGKRVVTATFTLEAAINNGTIPNSAFIILYSGEKGWIAQSDVPASAPAADPRNLVTVSVGTGNQKILSIVSVIDESEKAIIPYDSKIHGESFFTKLPVMRILFNANDEEAYKCYKQLSVAKLLSAHISLEVTGFRDVVIENDFGQLDPAKPFLPFGPQPKIGSTFLVGSSEVFQKDWTRIKINGDWKNKPESLVTQYAAYLQGYKNKISVADYEMTTSNVDENSGDPLVAAEDHFKVRAFHLDKGKWEKSNVIESDSNQCNLFGTTLEFVNESAGSFESVDLQNQSLEEDVRNALSNYLIAEDFSSFDHNQLFCLLQELKQSTETVSVRLKSDYFKLVLQKSFLHDLFPKIFSVAMVKAGKGSSTNNNTLIPNEPYTPMYELASIDYDAGIEQNFHFETDGERKIKLQTFVSPKIQFFHETPFGQSQQHVLLNELSGFIPLAEANLISLCPEFKTEGELYIGLKSAMPNSIVSLLIQVDEGSENPLASTFTAEKKITWSALCNNHWREFLPDEIVADDTRNFLQPGIIKLMLPGELTTTNHLLNSGYSWLRAKLPLGISFDAVSRFFGIYAQAVEAEFRNFGNELSHLESGIDSGIISKLSNKPPQVKVVSQPFRSFDGWAKESSNAFRLRISERLRHKHRAINIWDYEHLVLQKFPLVYKAKCLSHTCSGERFGGNYLEVAPGHVTLAVVPDLRKRSVFNPLQPRVSQSTLSEIESYLASLNSLHVKFDAIHPEYERIKLNLKVKFHNGKDPNTYRLVLNNEIVKYLSPWLYDEYAEINFGGSIHKSTLIAFIEKLDYVDYITDVKMYHLLKPNDLPVSETNHAESSSARSILVSASDHDIQLNPQDCP